MLKRAGRYLRISEDREGLEAGVTRQEEDTLRLAAENGLTVVATYPDNDLGASTRSRKPRPGYDALIKAARRGEFDTIIAYSSSRLTRRPREHEDLVELAERHGVRFLYCKSPSFDLSTADGRAVARILAASDAAEAERTGERVQRAARQRAEAGRPHGGARRYGFADDGITVVEPEAAVIRELTRRVVDGESVRGLAADLRDRGVPTARGGEWSARVVKEMVCRPRNVALVEAEQKVLVGADGEPVKAAWPALVDLDQWRTAVAVLTDPARGVWRGGSPVSLLTGLARCWCGQGRVTSGANDRYTSTCLHLKRSRMLVDAFVSAYVVGELEKDGGVTVASGPVRPVVDNGEQIATVRRQIDQLEDRLADDLLTPAAYRRQRERKQTQLAELVRQEVLTRVPDVMTGVTAAGFLDLPLDRRRAVVDFLCSITLVKRGADDPSGIGVLIAERQ